LSDVKIAIIGTGGVAQRHLGVLAQLPDLEVVGHVSADLARAEQQAARWGGHGYVEVAQMLDRERPAAVWMCVTPDRHGPTELALLERRVPFFVEKPLAVDLALAEELAQRIAQAGAIVGVGYKFRALDTLGRVRQLLDETPPRMVLGAWHDSLPPPPWWRQAARGGGQIVEQATHLVDLARYLIGEAEVVAALGGQWPRPDFPDAEVPDVSSALLRYASVEGAIPGLFSATTLLEGHQAIHLQLICRGRVLTISDQRLLIETGRHTDEIRSTADTFLVEDVAFLEAVRTQNGDALFSSYADALRTHRVCCAIRAAMDSPGGPTAVDR
jgi:predicted dehydrogenase